MNDSKPDDLRQLGDRLDWLYPADHADALLAMISPLFRFQLETEEAEAQRSHAFAARTVAPADA